MIELVIFKRGRSMFWCAPHQLPLHDAKGYVRAGSIRVTLYGDDRTGQFDDTAWVEAAISIARKYLVRYKDLFDRAE